MITETMDTSLTREVLVASRALLANPEAWTKGRYRRAAGEIECDDDFETPYCRVAESCRWCAMGVQEKALYDMGVEPAYQRNLPAEKLLRDAFREVLPHESFHYVEGYNDLPGTTHAHVLAAYNIAIQKAEELYG